MALALPVLGMAVQAAINDPSAYVRNRIFPRVNPSKTFVIEGGGHALGAYGYKAAAAQNFGGSNAVSTIIKSSGQAIPEFAFQFEQFPVVVNMRAGALPLTASELVSYMEYGFTEQFSMLEETITSRIAIELETDAHTAAAAISASHDCVTPWTNNSGNPFKNVIDAASSMQLSCGKFPNTLVLSRAAANAMILNPNVQVSQSANVAGMTGSQLEALIAQKLNLYQELNGGSVRPFKLVVGNAIKNTGTTQNATTLTGAAIWTTNLLCYVDDAAMTSGVSGERARQFGRTYQIDNVSVGELRTGVTQYTNQSTHQTGIKFVTYAQPVVAEATMGIKLANCV